MISDFGANLIVADLPIIKGYIYVIIAGMRDELSSTIEKGIKKNGSINKIGEIIVHKLFFVIIAIIVTIDIVATLYIIPIPISLIKYNIAL